MRKATPIESTDEEWVGSESFGPAVTSAAARLNLGMGKTLLTARRLTLGASTVRTLWTAQSTDLRPVREPSAASHCISRCVSCAC